MTIEIIREEFKVEIKRTRTFTQPGKEWVVIDKRPLTLEEIDNMTHIDRNKWAKEDAPLVFKPVMGYTETKVEVKETDTVIYSQIVPVLDIRAVIEAVNSTPDSYKRYIYNPEAVMNSIKGPL